MKKNLLIPFLSFFILFAIAFSSVSAQGSNTNTGSGGDTNPISIKLDNPFKVEGNLYDLARAIVTKIILPIGSVLCVLAFIYSGFMYVIARGDPGKIKTAHTSLLYTAIGTAVLLGAWVFAEVIQNTVSQVIG